MVRLCDVLVESLSLVNGQPVLINEWCRFLTFEYGTLQLHHRSVCLLTLLNSMIGDFGFGRTFGQLESGTLHPALEALVPFLRFVTIIRELPWLGRILERIPGVPDPAQPLFDFARASLREREKVSLRLKLQLV